MSDSWELPREEPVDVEDLEIEEWLQFVRKWREGARSDTAETNGGTTWH